MKKLTLSMAAVLLMTGSFVVYPQNRIFTGEITDSRCGKTGTHASLLETSRECTIECVRAGAKFVLYDAAKQRVYGLDNQRLPEGFAGTHVEVIGVLDPATRQIHVLTIEPSVENAQLVPGK
jgi:hypothetical protein